MGGVSRGHGGKCIGEYILYMNWFDTSSIGPRRGVERSKVAWFVQMRI